MQGRGQACGKEVLLCIKSVGQHQVFSIQEALLDVEVACVVKALEVSRGIWGGEIPPFRGLQGVPSEPLCVARKGVFECQESCNNVTVGTSLKRGSSQQ